MHIAFLTAEYPPQIGGVGDYTRCLAAHLCTEGHTVTVITGSGGAPPAAATTHEPATLRTIGGWGWRCWRDTIAALDSLRPQVLHIQYQTGAYGMHPAINLLPWRLRGLPHCPPIAITFHDLLEPYLFPKAGRLRRRITLRLARDAGRVVVTNAEDAARLQPFSPLVIPIGSNIAVAPPAGYQREAWRAHLGIQPGEVLIAYFGLLSHSKGVDVLLDALLHPTLAPLPLRLLLIGGTATAAHDQAYAAAIARQLMQPALHTRVMRSGPLDAVTVSAHLLAADCVVLPFRAGASLRSGSLLAALTHGVPVITTARPGKAPTEPLVDGANVLLTPPGDSAALAAALQRLAADAGLRARLGSAGQAAAAPFAWPAIAQQHAHLYAQMVRLSALDSVRTP